MQTNKERFPALVINFRKAIYDKLKEQSGGEYTPSTAGLRAAAFPAFKELVESEADPVDALLAVNVWSAVMLSNESAFHQQLERDIGKGLVTGLKLVKGAKAIASQYNE